MNKANFQALVRRILTEEISKRVPEMNANGVDADKKNKTFSSDSNTRDAKSKTAMVDDVRKALGSVGDNCTVIWDDHDDITINGRDKILATITPLWEDNYKIVFYTRNEDRLFFTGLNWKQVIDFVKNNIDKKEQITGVEKARDKAWRNNDDQTKSAAKGLSQADKPKIKKVGDMPNKEKDYNKKEITKEADLPDQSMTEVGDNLKKLTQYKVRDPVKLRKRIPDKKLVVKPK